MLPRGRGLKASVAGRRAAANSTSGNWSGYAAYGTSFNNVYAKWQVPAVNCSGFATGATSTWVGLDGYGNGTVEQLGTAEQCFWGGASYHAWYELYPAGEVALPSSYAVHPYDTMEARTMYLAASRSYYFYMHDISRGWAWALIVAAPSNPRPTNTTAEWIAEQPSCVYTCSWLANFGTTFFWDAEASRTGSGAQPITAFAHDAITMVNGSTVKAVPSSLYPTLYGVRVQRPLEPQLRARSWAARITAIRAASRLE